MNTDTRRAALYTALIAAAFSASLATAIAIPSVPALAQSVVPPTAPSADCAASCVHVSEGMQTLISEFVHASIRMAATDVTGDNEAIGIIAQDRTRALAALTFHRPENLMELAAKTSALVEFTEDVERFSLRMLAEDAAHLAQVTK